MFGRGELGFREDEARECALEFINAEREFIAQFNPVPQLFYARSLEGAREEGKLSWDK